MMFLLNAYILNEMPRFIDRKIVSPSECRRGTRGNGLTSTAHRPCHLFANSNKVNIETDIAVTKHKNKVCNIVRETNDFVR